VRVTGLGAVALTLFTVGCGSSTGQSSDVSAGCFRLSQAASEFNDAADAVKNSTATNADTAKAYGSIKGKLDDAVVVLPPGRLKDLASTAGVALGQARVQLLNDQADDTFAAKVETARTALTGAAPLCKGKT